MVRIQKKATKKLTTKIKKKIVSKLIRKSKKRFDGKALKDFKSLLIARKEAILEEINHISSDTLKRSQKDASGDMSGYSFHMADVATDNYDREFSLGLALNEQDQLYEIDAALQKIKEGSYGQCESCGRYITKTRLKAVPYAKLCIACKETEENKR